MAKSQYEGYCEGTPTKLVRENFGDIKVYTQNAKSLLNKATGFIAAYDFTLNPYRGCQYGCSYCYAAAFSPDTNMRQDWGKWVIIKENAAEILEKELVNWRKRNLHLVITVSFVIGSAFLLTQTVNEWSSPEWARREKPIVYQVPPISVCGFVSPDWCISGAQ